MFNKNIFIHLFYISLFLLFVSILFGFILSCYYNPYIYYFFKKIGLTFREFRPIHTTFAILWIYQCSIAIIYFYFFYDKKVTTLEYIIIILSFFILCIVILLLLFVFLYGEFIGREYIEFHPIISIFIIFYWLCFSFIFIKKVFNNFFGRPIYIYMWFCGMVYFIYCFTESHFWIFNFIWKYPIVDIQIQWKSIGSLVGSFNLLVYGCFFYLIECLGDKKNAYSKMSFLLFGISLLNSLTNYTHHTYHLPQNSIVKWIGFIISMLEILILIKVINSFFINLKDKKSDKYKIVYLCIKCVNFWNIINLCISIFISIPFFNAFVHGTYFIFAHSMSSMISIDTMILFSFLLYIIIKYIKIESKNNFYFINGCIYMLNIFLFIFIFSMSLVGLIIGINRYLGKSSLYLLNDISFVMNFIGCGFFFSIFSIICFILYWLYIISIKNNNKII